VFLLGGVARTASYDNPLAGVVHTLWTRRRALSRVIVFGVIALVAR
jgi:hypothetical protein